MIEKKGNKKANGDAMICGKHQLFISSSHFLDKVEIGDDN